MTNQEMIDKLNQSISLQNEVIGSLSGNPNPAWPISDRIIRPKPTPLAIGPAGYQFTDPSFNTSLRRITDESSSHGASCRVASNAHLSAFNSDSSIFFVVDEGNTVIFYNTDGVKLPYTIPGYGEPCFSYLYSNGIFRAGGDNNRTILGIDVTNGNITGQTNLDEKYPLSGEIYVGGVLVADNDIWATFWGGPAQDEHNLIYHSSGKSTNTLQYIKPFKIHSIALDRTGRFVFIYVRQQDIATVGKILIWDVPSNTFIPMFTPQNLPG